MIRYNSFLTHKINIKNTNKNSYKKLSRNFNKIFLDIKNNIKESKTLFNIFNANYEFNFKISDLNKFKKFKTIVIIGMGGSVLGSKAIYCFLKKKINKRIYFYDGLNENELLKLKKKENFKKILFLIISKSGNTIETLSNAFSLNIFKSNLKNIIIISEKKNNLLYSLSKKLNLFYIEHKNFIGGRYSVLSEAGIVPAYLMGVNIIKLRANILEVTKKKNKPILKDSTIKLTNLLFSNKMNNLIFLNYSPQLEQFLFWCQQLIAESLGKKNKGFLPVVSNAPKDHHSLLQLYLDGPKDKLFYIFSDHEKSKKRLNIKKIINQTCYFDKKNLKHIKVAQKNALIKSLKKKKIPFREFKIKKISEETLGDLFSYFMFETIIIGRLANLNPFDQPAVEQVKLFTKDLLS